MTGRNDQASTLGTNLDLLVATYRREYNYPSWFNNTLGYAEKGQISVQALQNAANNLLNEGHMTRKPMYQTKMDSKRVREIIKDYHGDDIEKLHDHARDFGTTLEEAKDERTSLQGKIDKLNFDSELFHNMHTDQETRISGKSGIGHTHVNGEEKEDCGWFGEKCWFKPPDWDLSWLKWVGLAIGAGLLLWLIRPLFKIGANLTK